TAVKSGMSPFPPRLRGASAVGDNPASFSLHVAAQTGFSYKARGVVVLSRSECVDGTEQSPRSRLGAAAAPPARERDPDARDGRGRGREVGPPRHADGHGRYRRGALERLPAFRADRASLARSRSVRALERPRLDAALRDRLP